MQQEGQMADKKVQAPEKEEKKGRIKLKLTILLLVVLGVLGAGGFAAWKFYVQPRMTQWMQGNATSTDVSGQGETRKAEDKGGYPAAGGQLVTLEPFVVNLADPMGRRYLKANMDVEVTDGDVAAELNAAMPKIKDALLLLLSSKSFADISSMDKKIELKNEIVDRLNLIIGKAKVRNVYFTEFVVQ